LGAVFGGPRRPDRERRRLARSWGRGCSARGGRAPPTPPRPRLAPPPRRRTLGGGGCRSSKFATSLVGILVQEPSGSSSTRSSTTTSLSFFTRRWGGTASAFFAEAASSPVTCGKTRALPRGREQQQRRGTRLEERGGVSRLVAAYLRIGERGCVCSRSVPRSHGRSESFARRVHTATALGKHTRGGHRRSWPHTSRRPECPATRPARPRPAAPSRASAASASCGPWRFGQADLWGGRREQLLVRRKGSCRRRHRRCRRRDRCRAASLAALAK
jgi:hypothetical protein